MSYWKMIYKGVLLLAVVLSSFQGCGSDDVIQKPLVSDDSSSKTQMVTGQFIDDFVQGLVYECSSQGSGVTDVNGTYSCAIGDDITFKIGELTIGTASANSGIITPYTLFPNDFDAAVNLARFLQTTDADGQADNGVIVIDVDMANVLPADTDFNSSQFETSVESALGIVLLSVTDAQRHLNDQIVRSGAEVPAGAEVSVDAPVVVPIDIIPPVADAGREQNVLSTSTVTLDGSGSHGAGSVDLAYLWSITAIPPGSNASLSDNTIQTPFFVADLNGTYVIELVVFEGDVPSATDSITITVTTENTAPVADAGDDQLVQMGTTVLLDGSKSSDADLDTLSYTWRFNSVPEASLASFVDTTDPQPTFLADKSGQYVIELTVEDESHKSSIDEVMITVIDETVHFDSSFARDGIAAVDIPAYANSMALDTDGSLFQAGGIYIWKYDSNGVLDDSFGGDGISTVPVQRGEHNKSMIQAISLDNTGGLYVAGYGENRAGDTDMLIWRFGSDGRLDRTFGDDGMVYHHSAAGGEGYDFASSIALDKDGQVYVVGYSENVQDDYDMVLWRYKPDGTLDTSFDGDGIVTYDSKAETTTTRRSLVLDRGNNLYVNEHDFGKAVAFDSAGDVYVLGISYYGGDDNFDTILWKYKRDGSLDSTFGEDGTQTYDSSGSHLCQAADDYAEAIELDSSGNIFVTGTAEGACRTVQMSLLKFGGNGVFIKRADLPAVDPYSSRYSGGDAMALDSAGNVYMTGYFGRTYAGWGRMIVVKYTNSLDVDLTFGDAGLIVYENPYGPTLDGTTCHAMTVDAHGGVYISGQSQYGPTDELFGESPVRTITVKYK